MNRDIERISDYFEKRREVIALFLFGSFDTSGERPDSDIDLAVLLEPRQVRDYDLENLKAEYYTASPSFSLRAIDIVILNTAPTSLKYEILKEGKIMLDNNPYSRKEFTARTVQEFFDYKPIEDICFNGLRNRLRKAVHG